jgi:hypothetical protein
MSSSSITSTTVSANQRAEYGAAIGLDEPPKPGRSSACTR